MIDEIKIDKTKDVNSKAEISSIKSAMCKYSNSLDETLVQLQNIYLKYNPSNKYNNDVEK